MHFTFHTVIQDGTCQDKLGEMAAYHSKTERRLYAAIAADNFNPGAFKKEFCEKHHLTSRQFNSMALEVKGKIAGTRESIADNIEVLQSQLKTTKNALSDLKSLIKKGVDAKGRVIGAKKMAQKEKNKHEKERKVGRLQDKIKALEARVEAPVPGICFGNKKLFMEQFNEDDKPKDAKQKAAYHEDWLKRWHSARDSQFLIVGTGEEQGGCASCQPTLEEDGTLTLRLRPFNSMLAERDNVVGKDQSEMKRRKTITAKAEDLITIRGVKFRHGTKYIHEAIARNQGSDKKDRTPLTFRFLKADNGLWYVHLSLEVPETAIFDAIGGAVGIDFNEDHIAATVVDRCGNFIMCRRFDLNLYGKRSLHAKDLIRCAAKEIVTWAKTLNLPIVAEGLDFQKKKKSMANMSAKRSRKFSSLHYASWGQALQSRCLRDSVAVNIVNPAYTSIIGRLKFATQYGLSVHHAAAMAIARRGMGFSERLPHSSVRYPDGMGSHNTLNPVANMGHRHVWVSWARQNKTINAARVARLSDEARARQRRRLAHKATPNLTRELYADDCLPF